MKFVKYINENQIENAPSIIFDEKVYIANPTDEIYRVHGYKPLYENEYPELSENEYVERSYTEEEDRVVLVWTVKQYEPENQVTDDETDEEEEVENG